ncbi:component of SufBCD complex [Roseovarius spongiae]|uniref:Component of SufBCD complex n=1 Tax=Roseovarius spongiae TaxID=2320272 RepID=A0A3A8AYH9_9RHOB|nr:component of SufBCD complex [Roseovarius spongiae]RKF17037.1 component of SufBCD complex [Roseovarius spongiae]
MDWYTSVFELIDMRSFSNLWFWIALAVLWSSAGHWIMGVPWDMVTRADKAGGQALADLETVVHISAGRILYITHEAGVLMAGFAGFLLTVLVLLGFVYGREFAQAVFLLGAPMGVVWLMSIRTARRIKARGMRGEDLVRALNHHRFLVRLLGMVSIFVTAMWGMYQNMSASALWG